MSNTSAFAPLPTALISGQPVYMLGSLNRTQQDTMFQVTTVALTSDVATITGYIRAGNIPVAGNLISIQGCANIEFNVASIAITSVSIDSTGTGTIVFPLTHADVVAIADAGQALIPVQEVPAAVVAGLSNVVYIGANEPNFNAERTVTVSTTFPTIQATTGAATLTLYSSLTNDPVPPGAAGSSWSSVGVVGTLAAGAQTVGGTITFTETRPAGRFYVIATTPVIGTWNTVVAKINA